MRTRWGLAGGADRGGRLDELAFLSKEVIALTDYKFLQSEHIGYLLKGSMRISSLSHYRALKCEQWIADIREGTTEVDVIHFDSNEHDYDTLTPIGYSPLVGPSKGRVILDDVLLSYPCPDVFIFCASRGDLRSLSEAMWQGEDPAKKPYDACVRIVDIEHLAHRMFHRGVVVEMGGAKVSQLFGDFRCKPVEYSNFSWSPKIGRPPPPSPFVKHYTFAEQREIRIVFQPRQAILLQSLTIKIPRPERLLVEEFRSPCSG